MNSLIVIGASAGSPKIIVETLAPLPTDFSSAIVIVLHLDEVTAESMTQWMSSRLNLRVQIAQPGTRPVAGNAYLAGFEKNLILDEEEKFQYSEIPLNEIYRPSINEFFASCALNWNGMLVAILMSGMGQDGCRGLLALRRLGYRTIVQDSGTTNIKGMLQKAISLDAGRNILPPEKISLALLNS